MLAAAELFPIRHVCAFGRDLPDGVVPLDDVFAPDAPDFSRRRRGAGPAAAHVAVVTFDVTAAGIVPVARNHRATYRRRAGAVFLEAGIAQAANILSAIPPALVCRHRADPAALAAQRRHAGAASRLRPESSSRRNAAALPMPR